MNRGHRNIVKYLSLISQLSITVLTPVILMVALGVWLDRKFETWFTLPFLILGILAGARSAYLMAKSFIEKDEGDER